MASLSHGYRYGGHGYPTGLRGQGAEVGAGADALLAHGHAEAIAKMGKASDAIGSSSYFLSVAMGKQGVGSGPNLRTLTP